MKITNPLLTKALGLFGATLIRGWTTTLDYRIVYQDPTVDPVHPRCRPRALYILWHEYLICPLGVRGRNMSVLISQHRDGELITQVLRHLGFKVIRGSSTRGGIAAIKKVVRGWGDGQKSAEHATSIREPASDNPSPGANACGFTDSTWSAQCQKGTAHAPLSGASRCAAGVAGTKTMVPDSALSTQHSALSSHHPSTSPPLHLIITPDGPRGPRRQLQEGAVFLAARLGIPIVCMGFAFDRPWRLKSWDQFAIPRPFSRARAVISGYLDIPPVAPGSATGMSKARMTNDERMPNDRMTNDESKLPRYAGKNQEPNSPLPALSPRVGEGGGGGCAGHASGAAAGAAAWGVRGSFDSSGLAGGTPVPPSALTQHSALSAFLEPYRLQLERILSQVTEEAEHWAESGSRKPGEMPFLRNEPAPVMR